jgi:hypothetical protein
MLVTPHASAKAIPKRTVACAMLVILLLAACA